MTAIQFYKFQSLLSLLQW